MTTSSGCVTAASARRHLERAHPQVLQLELAQALLADERAQIGARHPLLHQVERDARLLERGVQPRDAGVAELAEHLGLALVQLEALPAGAELHPLDHHLLAARDLGGEVGLALGAAPELRPSRHRPSRSGPSALAITPLAG